MTLFGPVLAMVAVTFVVWLRLYHLRLREMRQARIAPQRLALSAPKESLLKDTRASDNFSNLFEFPVLFHVGALIAMQAAVVDQLLLGLAWAFVGLRAVHSLIQCSYNRVMHRFTVYLLASLVLAAFWTRLAFVLTW
jgi:hypothetical protein